MLVRCLYASRVTGLLCFTKSAFLQIIEGSRDAFNELSFCIARDDRHHQVRLLAFEALSQRRYSNWTMGQVDRDNINADLILKYSETAELNPFACSGQATFALLDELVATGSIRNRSR